MISDLKKHLFEYFLLFIILVISVFAFSITQDKIIRFNICLLFSIYYFSWSILHHGSIGKLNISVMLEYLLIIGSCLLLLKVLLF